MKKRRTHKLIAMLLAAIMVFSTIPAMGIGTVFAQGGDLTLPTSLEKPNIILFDMGDFHTNFIVRARTPISILGFYENAETKSFFDDEDRRYSEYGEWSYDYDSGIQVDWKIDNDSWQYTSEWDEALDCSEDCHYEHFYGKPFTDIGIGSSWGEGYTGGIVSELKELGYLISTTDGEETFLRLDTVNHKITVRARYFFTVKNNDETQKIILSPWSDEAVYGKGNRTDTTPPASLSAPVLADLEIYGTNWDNSPYVHFNVLHTEDVLAAMQWSEQFDSHLQSSSIGLELEASLDPSFSSDSLIVPHCIWTPSRRVAWEGMIYDLWWELADKDGDTFYWEGETAYLRARWVNDREVDGSDSSIRSPYSNVLSITPDNVGRFNVTVTHEPYGFDENGFHSESYKVTDGVNYGDIYCSPLEGCYVDTITVNNAVMYDHDEPSTYDLLEHNNSCTDFRFKEDKIAANRNLNIVITYAGTPTVTYGISTQEGEGGSFTTSVSPVSWNDNSLVVYHGTAPTINIHPHAGYEIDKVFIDGIENPQAKADGAYTFPAITDNSHSITATFKRVSYRVYSNAYNGTITTDYVGYDEDDYVKIGDDITFTFAPSQDSFGNYYEIVDVYIDNVLNEQAKNAGTYTFTNVHEDHSIHVNYSEYPVITHDVVATSGDNGRISPTGTVHVREGSNYRFDFYPDEGFEVDKVFIDGIEITNLASKEYYTVSNVTTDRTIRVTFKKTPVQYTVNVEVSGGNPSVHTVNPKGETPVWEGESFTVNYSPATGYEIEKVLVDGSEVAATGTYTIESVDYNSTIEIIFKIKHYTVTFVDYDGTPLKTETVDHGSAATPPQTPTREHYVFDRWDVNFSNITTAVSVRATYVPATYTVKFIGWDGSLLKTEKVEYTKSATAPTPPERKGYTFDRWSRDFTDVNSDLEVTAVYTLICTHTDTVVCAYNGNGTHSQKCTFCDTILETENCSGGKATCTEKGRCTVCQGQYLASLGHKYDEAPIYDETHHWSKCTRCDVTKSKSAHIWKFDKEITPASFTASGVNRNKCTGCAATQNVVVKQFLYGDVNCDGEVRAADARLCLRQSVGLESYKEGSRQYIACNVDGVEGVRAADARLILRYSVGLESSFPVNR